MNDEHQNKTTASSQTVSAKTNNYMVPCAIVIAGVLIAGAVYFSVGQRTTNTGTAIAPPQQQPPSAQTADISKVKTDGRPFIGNPNAQVTIAYWFDHQCPFCRKFEEESMPQLYKDYVQTGKVKFVYKDFQFLGPDSQTLGRYSHAVWETAPDKFYAWHKSMYDNQGTENTGWATSAKIRSITESVLGSADTDKVVSLVASKGDQYQKMMDEDKAEGGAFGVSGTPSFVIGKQLLVGAQPYSAIKQLIDLAL